MSPSKLPPVRWLALAGAVLAACTDAEPPPRGEPWTAGPALPGRRLEAAVAAWGQRLVVAGGFSTSMAEGLEITREAYALDTLTGAWEALPALPVAWTHAALASIGGTLYLLGGLEGASYVARGEAYALDLGADAWRALPAMPAGSERGAASVIVAPPHLVLVGGEAAGEALVSVLDYDTITGAWTELPALPTPRSHPAAMRRDDGTLVVAGGLARRTNAPLADTYTLAPGATAWQPRAPMPARRGGCAHGRAAGWLVCAGGEAGSIVLGSALAYDSIADAWHELPDMPAPRAGAPGAAIGQRLYVAGGSRSFAFEPTADLVVLSVLDALPR